MAKYEARLHGDFDDTLRYIHEGILNASMSASFEMRVIASPAECAAVYGCTSGTASAVVTECPWP